MEVITRVTQKITLLNVNFLQLCTRYSSLQASMETDWKGRPSWEISALNINNRCLSPSRLTAVVMFSPVMWSETVGLRTRPVWVQKKSVSVVVLVLHVWCSFVKHDLVTLVVIMILNDTATFQVLFIVSPYCAWNITTVEINSGVHLLKS